MTACFMLRENSGLYDCRSKKGEQIMTSRQIEVLAPAGSYECFRAALSAGADAVYAGGTKFGARAYADNFTEDELIQAIEEAHLFGKRLYLTVNTLLKDSELRELYDYLFPLYSKGLDAVIVQDAGVMHYIRREFPDLEIHASTQMTVTGYPGASFLEKCGVKRVVPARELSLQEIHEIREHTDLEIECFVHGALCYCYSGQCLLSSMIGGRSGNRGQCAQPCRLPWIVNGKKKYYMSLKDICTLDLIPDLARAGIDSFKIEGRMKKPEYVAAVTSMYRKYTDLWMKNGSEGYKVDDADREILMDLYNRGGFRTGYYRQHNGTDMLCLDRPNHAGVPAVKVTVRRGRKIEGTALTDLGKGDVLELGTGKKDNHTMGTDIRRGEKVSFLLPKGADASRGTVFPRVRNEKLIRDIQAEIAGSKLRRDVEGIITMTPGNPAVLTVSCGSCTRTVRSLENVQTAENRPLDEIQVKKRMQKTGETDFRFERLDVRLNGNVFLPVQELNRMRREVLDALREGVISSYYRTASGKEGINVSKSVKQIPSEEKSDSCMLSVSVETLEQLEAAAEYISENKDSRIRRVYADCSMVPDFFSSRKIRKILEDIRQTERYVYPAMPYIFREKERKLCEKWQKSFTDFPMDGMLIRNYEEAGILRQCGFDKKLILDHNLYVFNNSAKDFWSGSGVTDFTAPPELSEEELAQLGLASAELTVYGYIPVMLSAQCITSASSGCRRQPGIIYMEDRFGNKYPVKNNCTSCYNIIYNTLPVYLGDLDEQIKKTGPAYLRIQFTVENAEKVPEILSLFENRKSGKNNPGFEFTRGHFMRGII